MPDTTLGVFLSGRKRKFFQQNQTYKHRQQTDGRQRKGAEGMGRKGVVEWELQASSYGMTKSQG